MKDNKKIDNICFLLRICFDAAPMYMISLIVYSAISRLIVFVEHVYSIKYILEIAEFNKPFKLAVNMMIIVFILLLTKLLVDAFYDNLFSIYLLPQISMRVKEKIYSKAQKMDIKNYDDPSFFNDFTMAVKEVDKIIERLINSIKCIVEGITGVVCCGTLYALNDRISIVFVLISFVGCFVVDLFMAKVNFKIAVEKNYYERKRDYCKRIFYLNEYAKEIRTIPQIVSNIEKKFDDSNREIAVIEKKYIYIKAFLEFIKNFVFNGLCLNIFYVIYLLYKVTITNSISVSTFAVLYDSGKQFRDGLNVISKTFTDITENGLYIEKIRHFLNIHPKVISTENQDLPKGAVEIAFKNVSFRYNDDEPYIINNLSFTLKKGKSLAIVGDNGAGKTTIVKLILRMYDPNEGEIFLNGINIKKFNIDEYRKFIGVVFQDFQVYAFSLLNNVVMNEHIENYDICKNKAQNLLEIFGFDKITTLPYGLETSVTNEFDEKGIDFSGGEKQKIVTARAFYNPHGIYVLDEPSSALDPISEDVLGRAMQELADNNTRIFISHRLAMAKDADEIIVLENGKIIESGNHDTLLQRQGKYSEMWKVQSKHYIEACV